MTIRALILPWNVLVLRYSLVLWHIQHGHDLLAIRILCLRILFQPFICGLSPPVTCLHLRYSVSYTKAKHWQFIPCKVEFMKVELHKALNTEICENLQFENTWINYIKSNITTQRFVLQAVDCDKNGLVFTKCLHIMM